MQESRPSLHKSFANHITDACRQRTRPNKLVPRVPSGVASLRLSMAWLSPANSQCHTGDRVALRCRLHILHGPKHHGFSSLLRKKGRSKRFKKWTRSSLVTGTASERFKNPFPKCLRLSLSVLSRSNGQPDDLDSGWHRTVCTQGNPSSKVQLGFKCQPLKNTHRSKY